MSAVESVTGAVALSTLVGSNQSTAARPSASLLPEPSGAGADGLEALFAIMAKDRQTGLRHSVREVQSNKVTQHKARERALAEMAAALRDHSESGFWHDLAGKCLKLAKVAVVAAAVAAAVGSGGAATPVVVLAWSGAVMSSAAFLQGETHYLQKLGLNDKQAQWAEIGMTVAGAGATGCAMFGDPSIAANGYFVAASAAGGAATAAGGVATIKAAKYDERAQKHQARATGAMAEKERLEGMLRQILADLAHAEKSEERTLDSLRGAISAKGDAIALAARRV